MRPVVLLPLACLLVSAAGPGSPQAQKPAARAHDVRIELRAPTRIAVTPAGELLVSDHALRRVGKVVPGQPFLVDSFAIDGHPTALGVLGARVFVGNEDADRVQVHALDGALLGTLGGAGFQVGDPRDLEIDAQLGRLFVVDGIAKAVEVFDLATTTGTHLATIGVAGTLPSNFQNPTGIALDPAAQEVLVADFGSLGGGAQPRVLVFGYDGSFHGVVSGDGGPTGQYFARPQGLLLGSSGHLFVVDSWRGEVVVMDRASGNQVGLLGAYGKQPGELLLPLDAAVLGPDEDLVVTSCKTRRIELFAKGGTL